MIFASLGSIGGKACRDSQGAFVPVPQCTGRRRKIAGLSNAIGAQTAYTPPVFITPGAPDAGSYQQIWDFLWSSCVSMAGPDACTRLLGHTPFVCPVEQPRKGSFLVPLLVGVAIGKIIL